MTLYEISNKRRADFDRVHELLEELQGDVTDPEVGALIDELLTGTDDDLKSKVDDYCALIKEEEATAQARLTEAARLTFLAQTNSNLVVRLKERLKMFFEDHDIQKIETPRFKLSIANNGGKVRLIVPDDLDVNQLPEQFQKLIPAVVTVDNEAIRQALESGETVDGFALAPRGTRLAIK